MDIKKIMSFLTQLSANNNRQWFAEYKKEYLDVKAEFERAVAQAIVRIAEFDGSVAHIMVKDATYRINRDTRFSSDKSPYKTHMGAYIAAHGKKALHGGYYIHLEPEHCLLACGNYWLPTNILTSCRNEIMGNIDEWRQCVENERFLSLFGKPGQGSWDSPRGFGLEHLKTCPSGFPRDYEHIEYLRMKDYCCWTAVPESFFEGEKWLDDMAEIMETGKPMMDFINNVIDDYE